MCHHRRIVGDGTAALLATHGIRLHGGPFRPRAVVPAAAPLAAIASGPLHHIVGKFNGAAPALVNTAGVVIGVDGSRRAEGLPGVGLAVRQPVAHGYAEDDGLPRHGDLLGEREARFVVGGCLVVDFMLGTGVAIYNNPTSVGFGTLLDPAMTPNAQAAALNAQIDAAVNSVTSQVTSDPTVNSVLTTITGALPL